MANFERDSLKNGGNGYIPGFELNAELLSTAGDLSTTRLVQPEKITELPGPDRPVGASYLQALKKGKLSREYEVNSVTERLRISENEVKSLRQQLHISNNENKFLRQQLRKSENDKNDLDSMVGYRQLFNFFRFSEHGRAIDECLMDWARKQARRHSSSKDIFESSLEYFSSQVIHLWNQKITLTNALKIKESSNHQRQLDAVTSKLNKLEEAAKTFKTREMTWEPVIGEGIFAWCLLVAETNKKCHHDMSTEFLNAMRCRSENGECKFAGFNFQRAAFVVIQKLHEEEENKIAGLRRGPA